MKFRCNIRRVGAVCVLSFLAPMAMLIYWQAIRASSLRANPSNRHAEAKRKRITRGDIISAGGTRLAFNVPSTNVGGARAYPFRDALAQTVGYDSRVHGRAGIERSQDMALMGLGEFADPWGSLWTGRSQGCTVRLSINASAQQAAYSELLWRRGAIVAVAPDTGAVLVVASAPSFDPNEIDQRWDSIVNAEGSPLLNRATAGVYEAGDMLGLVVAAAALDAGRVRPDERFSCSGTAVVAGRRLKCSRARGHGRISLRRALVEGCSVAMARVVQRTGVNDVRRCFAALGLDEKPDIGVPCAAGRLYGDVAVGGSVTPLGMARLAACIANDGIVMRPYLVSDIVTARGRTKASVEPAAEGRGISKDVADRLTSWLTASVQRGLARHAEIDGVQVAGLAGSAVGPGGRRDSWFVGFAPADRASVAVAVVIENAGPRSEQAASAARTVISHILGSQRPDSLAAGG